MAERAHIAAMIKPEAKDALERLAAEEGRTLSNMIERLLLQALQWRDLLPADPAVDGGR